jgi:hypothetical protein
MPPVLNPDMVQINPFGTILVLVGLLWTIWPYRVSSLGESLLVSGSEPTDLRVTLTRIIGIIAILIGIAVTFRLIF